MLRRGSHGDLLRHGHDGFRCISIQKLLKYPPLAVAIGFENDCFAVGCPGRRKVSTLVQRQEAGNSEASPGRIEVSDIHIGMPCPPSKNETLAIGAWTWVVQAEAGPSWSGASVFRWVYQCGDLSAPPAGWRSRMGGPLRSTSIRCVHQAARTKARRRLNPPAPTSH